MILSCRHCGRIYKGRQESTSCSRECAVASRDQSGGNNPNWKGGDITPAIKGRRYRSKYPEKDAAHRAVRQAIRNGFLARRPCEICREPSSQAHHDDYSRPLKVRWLCKEHHIAEHAVGIKPGHPGQF